MSAIDRGELVRLRARLCAARAVAMLTGAGVSAESGVPTFRCAGGLWRNFRAEDLATPAAFARGAGAFVADVNPGAARTRDIDAALRGPAGEILPLLVR